MTEPTHNDIIQRISVLETEMKTVQSVQTDIREDVKAIRTSVDQGKGGWRIITAFGIPIGIGAGVLAFIQQIFGKSP